jgi:F-type H+-transporting ATPase subunit delta
MLVRAKSLTDNSVIEIEERVDPELIGGFVLRLDDKQIDTSIASQIKELRSSFENNPYISEL